MDLGVMVGMSIFTMFGSGLFSMATGRPVEPSFFDYFKFCYFYYTYFPEEYTTIIDRLLISTENFNRELPKPFPNILKSDIGHEMIQVNGNKVPSYGKHTCHLALAGKKGRFRREKISLEKIFIRSPHMDKNITIYRAKYFLKKKHIAIDAFTREIKNSIKTGSTISTISIDTSSIEPKLIITPKIYHPPKANQIIALNQIMSKWTKENHFNLKVMICGNRGIGKTFMGPIIKRKIDSIENKNYCCGLYDDFDPKCVGLNIKSLALQAATEMSPVILVINEIDKIYDYVLEEKQSYDTRLQHAKDPTSFHNMLDALGSIENVLTIFTTEKSPEQLQKNEAFKSFMRMGRVDYFIKMTATGSKMVANEYM